MIVELCTMLCQWQATLSLVCLTYIDLNSSGRWVLSFSCKFSALDWFVICSFLEVCTFSFVENFQLIREFSIFLFLYIAKLLPGFLPQHMENSKIPFLYHSQMLPIFSLCKKQSNPNNKKKAFNLHWCFKSTNITEWWEPINQSIKTLLKTDSTKIVVKTKDEKLE